jgi:anti-sigma regulatory factor (Ser/Thr protein kinase)
VVVQVLTMESTEASVADARALTTQYVADRCRWVDLDSVQLVVSELVTNAERHAAGWWRLTVFADVDLVRVEVRDSSDRPVRQRRGALDGSGGWGLYMVERSASCLETRAQQDGKTVSACWHPWASPDRVGHA